VGQDRVAPEGSLDAPKRSRTIRNRSDQAAFETSTHVNAIEVLCSTGAGVGSQGRHECCCAPANRDCTWVHDGWFVADPGLDAVLVRTALLLGTSEAR
jgi:hypothetical protein